jgi:hypothetical protein
MPSFEPALPREQKVSLEICDSIYGFRNRVNLKIGIQETVSDNTVENQERSQDETEIRLTNSIERCLSWRDTAVSLISLSSSVNRSSLDN